MARQLQIAIPSDETNLLLEDLQRLEGIIGLSVQRGVSIKPPGDIVTAEVSSRSLSALMRLLDERKIGQSPNSSITTSEPTGLISTSSTEMITHDTSEALWEEMELILTKESNMTAGMHGVMAISGFVAAVGIVTGVPHLVIGAMVIAPGFEPLIRITLGVVTQSRAWIRGLRFTAQGYVALLLGAALAALVMRATGISLLSEEGYYADPHVLVSYWTSLTVPSLLVSSVASVAGTIFVASNRSVLTAGVMIALALIPSATMVSIALVAASWSVAGQALLRWAVDAALVLIFSALVFMWKRYRLHRRRMTL